MMASLEYLKPCLRGLAVVLDGMHLKSHEESYSIGSLADFQKLVSFRTNALS